MSLLGEATNDKSIKSADKRLKGVNGRKITKLRIMTLTLVWTRIGLVRNNLNRTHKLKYKYEYNAFYVLVADVT